jgi:GDP-L-fucose synthase
MPTNLYGPNDNFNLMDSHVLPALIRKFHDAKVNGDETVEFWGTGSPKREFLYVDDLANALVFLMNNYHDCEEHINVGCGEDITIKDLVTLVKEVVDYDGKIMWNVSYPDGTPQKLLDVSKINNLGWKAKTSLEDGLRITYKWFVENYNTIRK